LIFGLIYVFESLRSSRILNSKPFNSLSGISDTSVSLHSVIEVICGGFCGSNIDLLFHITCFSMLWSAHLLSWISLWLPLKREWRQQQLNQHFKKWKYIKHSKNNY
jgi:hypothetical protein